MVISSIHRSSKRPSAKQLVTYAGLEVTGVRGAVYYPPSVEVPPCWWDVKPGSGTTAGGASPALQEGSRHE